MNKVGNYANEIFNNQTYTFMSLCVISNTIWVELMA